MKIVSYSDIGARNNNEDSIALGEFVFALCDGVGGISKGEVASRFVASSIIRKMQGVEKSSISAQLVQKIVFEIQDELNKSLTDHPDYHGMGTTLCAVFTSDKEVLLVHIGDSRIYFVKPNEKKYWRTTDHSTVAELVQSGILKEEDAKNHYLSNQITRAIQAIQGIEPSVPDLTTTDNIETGDLIFICSDGVLESFSDKDLLEILIDKNTKLNKKLETIEVKCKKGSSDNNTAIILEFEDEDQINTQTENDLNWNYLPNQDPESQASDNNQQTKAKTNKQANIKSNNSLNTIIRIALYTFAILFIAFLTLTLKKKSSKKSISENRELITDRTTYKNCDFKISG